VDKTLIPNLPGVLLKAGKFHQDIDIIVGHNRFFPYLITILTILSTTDFVMGRGRARMDATTTRERAVIPRDPHLESMMDKLLCIHVSMSAGHFRIAFIKVPNSNPHFGARVRSPPWYFVYTLRGLSGRVQ
jgi:hypothetical protein